MPLTPLDDRVALVVIDLQRGVVTASTSPHGTADVVARSVTLADAFRAHALPVVLVRTTSSPDGVGPGRSDVPRRGGPRPAGWDVLIDELAGHPDDVVVTKRSVGAFAGTDLDRRLRDRGVTQVVLTGVATTMGVESTARAAHDHGYHVAVVADAVADRDADDHRHALTRTLPRFAETTTVAGVLAALPA